MRRLPPLTPEEFIRAPGSRIEAAQAMGIDLTVPIEQLRLTRAERARKLESAATSLEKVRGAARRRS